ncbi:sulfurtransferase TusA family protein [Halovenus sp. WSH3]|uniref:Sulfurtransferase TusA family protein n=1 Tax=Halovenus carboxidivorans TaxID=2692199 RepID=A0A6B0TBQ3_9EURY|nr:sulfurtransferase TusA family protein [Halovenus carboxidivorans]MXR52330.1 sulfurtransferase TusA family protein [Halovenus carboxidivorans]
MTESQVPSGLPECEPEMSVDNRGTGCANGIARVQRALEDLDDGDVLEILSTDRRAKEEYPRLAEQTPHELLGIESERKRLVRTEYTTYLRVRERTEGGDSGES